MFYTCTTFGDRVIKGVPDSDGMIVYTMTGTAPFRIVLRSGSVRTMRWFRRGILCIAARATGTA
jgi:hypothetical protein